MGAAAPVRRNVPVGLLLSFIASSKLPEPRARLPAHPERRRAAPRRLAHAVQTTASMARLSLVAALLATLLAVVILLQ